jgi:hypothetical protein
VIDKGSSNGLSTDLRGVGFPRIVDDPDETNAGDGADSGNGALQIARTDLNVSNSTIANNEGGGIRPDISAPNGVWTVKSSIIAGN